MVYCWLQPISKQEFKQIFWPASMHAIGHIAANLSFAAVAISLTHTVKTLEPAFNVVLSRALLGTVTPTPVIATLVPIMVSHSMVSRGASSGGVPGAVWCGLCLVADFTYWDCRTPTPELTATCCSAPQVGVAMASAAELSFNWMGFISAMVSNLTFGFRAVLSKKCGI